MPNTTGTESPPVNTSFDPHILERINQEDVDKELRHAVEVLFRYANYYGGGNAAIRALMERMRGEHRTIQQSFMSIIKTFVEWYAAKPDIEFDLRNRAARDWARLVSSIPGRNTCGTGMGFPLV